MAAAPVATPRFCAPEEFVEYTGTEHQITGGSSPEIRLFTERASGLLYVGKCSQTAISSDTSQQLTNSYSWGFVCRYQEELREAIALCLYESALGVTVPAVCLCELPTRAFEINATTASARTLHLMTRFIHGLALFGEGFVAEYLAHSRAHPDERFTVAVPNTAQRAPLVGFGALLAAAQLIDDGDVIGATGGNAGYMFDATTGNCNVIKFDAGNAFGFLNSDTNVSRAVTSITVDQRTSVRFTSLTGPDRDEYIATLQRALINLLPEDANSVVCRVASFVTLRPGVERTVDRLPREYTQLLLKGLGHHLRKIVRHYREKLAESINRQEEDVALNVAQSALQSTIEPIDVGVDFTEKARRLGTMRGTISRYVPDDRLCEDNRLTFQLPALPEVVGRDAKLVELHRAIQESGASTIISHHRMSMVGMGGVGKTTLAAQYAWLAARGATIDEHQLRYSHVVWFRAEHDVEMQQQCIALAHKWCGGLETTGAAALTKLWKFFGSANWPTLVVFDNASDAKELTALLSQHAGPSTVQVHVIITTRDNRPCQGVSTIRIESFDLAGTRAFIRARFPDGGEANDVLIEQVHHVVDGLPLALVQIAAYMRDTRVSLNRVLELFNANQTDLIMHGQLPLDPHPRTVGTLVTLAAAHLDHTNPDASAMLRCAAYLPPEKLIREVMMAGSDIQSDDSFKAALESLLSLGLVAEQADGRITIHRLIQECVRYYLNSLDICEHVESRLAQAFIYALDGESAQLRATFLPSAVFAFELLEKRHASWLQWLSLSISWCLRYDLINEPIATKFIKITLTRICSFISEGMASKDLQTLIDTGLNSLRSSFDDRVTRAVQVGIACHYCVDRLTLDKYDRGIEVTEALMKIVRDIRGRDTITEAYLLRHLSYLNDPSRTRARFSLALDALGLWERRGVFATEVTRVVEVLVEFCEPDELFALCSRVANLCQTIISSVPIPALVPQQSIMYTKNDVLQMKAYVLSIVLILKQHFYGPIHVQTAITLTNIASCGIASTDQLERALTINEEVHGVTSLKLVEVLKRLIDAYELLPGHAHRRLLQLRQRLADIYLSHDDGSATSMEEIDDVLVALLRTLHINGDTSAEVECQIRRYNNFMRQAEKSTSGLFSHMSSIHLSRRLFDIGCAISFSDGKLALRVLNSALARSNVEADGRSTEIAYTIGQCLSSVGSFQEAISYYCVAIKNGHAADKRIVLEMLGVAHFCAGQTSEAVGIMRQCVQARSQLRCVPAFPMLHWRPVWNIEVFVAETTRDYSRLEGLACTVEYEWAQDIAHELNLIKQLGPREATMKLIIGRQLGDRAWATRYLRFSGKRRRQTEKEELSLLPTILEIDLPSECDDHMKIPI